MKTSLESLSCRDAHHLPRQFSYFADAFDLTILRAMEEEAGSRPPPVVADIVAEIRLHQLPAIFTEVNGAVPPRRFTGNVVFPYSPGSDERPGQDPGIAAYLAVNQCQHTLRRHA
ncbi:MAG: hypothetical protein ACLS63_06675 [Flavonifractor plautii]